MAEREQERARILNQFGELRELSPIDIRWGHLGYKIAEYSPDEEYVRFEPERDHIFPTSIEYFIPTNNSNELLIRRSLDQSEGSGHFVNAEIIFVRPDLTTKYHFHYIGYNRGNGFESEPTNAFVEICDTSADKIPLVSVDFETIYEGTGSESQVKGGRVDKIYIPFGESDDLLESSKKYGKDDLEDSLYLGPARFPGIAITVKEDLSFDLSTAMGSLDRILGAGSPGQVIDIARYYSYAYSLEKYDNAIKVNRINRITGSNWELNFPETLDSSVFYQALDPSKGEWSQIASRVPVILNVR